MSRFAIRNPYLVVVVCLITCVVGLTALLRLPIDLFPEIRIPVVVVATFYSGMPPEQIENDITGRFERFFTLASGIDHIESRSLPGVSLIKVYFRPGSNPDSAVTTIANLASANLRRLPPGTLPPVVLKFDASSLPICLITLKGKGMNEAKLRDFGQYTVRNQISNVPGASVPQPFGGRYRQIVVYVDPLKLEAHHLSAMDVVRSVNDSNLILPAGDIRIGPFDYNLYANSQLESIEEINRLPLKFLGNASVLVADVGRAADAAQIQYNVVRVDGQPSVFLPVLKQGGNTISVVKGIKRAVNALLDVPEELVTEVVFDQSMFVKSAIQNLCLIGAIGLLLTAGLVMVLFNTLRATMAVFLSIPLSVLAAFIALSASGHTINTMVLGGLALAFPRLINNSVVVLENIFRHLELGESPALAAELGGREVALPVFAATLATAIVFFPVVFLYGVSRFLFTALALAVVLSLAASYVIAMTVVPLFCAKYLKRKSLQTVAPVTVPYFGGVQRWFSNFFSRFLSKYEHLLDRALHRPGLVLIVGALLCILGLGLYPFVGTSYFPRTDPGQFMINVKGPSGTRLEETAKLIERVEEIIKQEVPDDELDVIVANVGVTPGFSSLYTANSAPHTATVQASLESDHDGSSHEYMSAIRERLRTEIPEISAYFQTGGLVDSVINLGFPAPIDIQISGSDLEAAHAVAVDLARRARALPGVSDVLVPQDMDYPALKLDIDRTHAAKLGLSSKEVVQNVITALTSDQMIAPSYWVDPETGNDYLLTVQYPEGIIKDFSSLMAIPLRGTKHERTTRLDAVSSLRRIDSPTEVDHYQLRRVVDVYVAPSDEDLGRLSRDVEKLIAETELPEGLHIHLRGVVQGMRNSFGTFARGLILAVVLAYLILLAQFKSFLDPVLILLPVPAAIVGVLAALFLTGTPLNVMSVMGVIMVIGIVASNSILVVDFIQRLRADGMAVGEAVRSASRVRMRPVLITSLATLLALFPMAAKLGTGSEAYAPLALAIVGGVAFSLIFTMFAVPAAYALCYKRI